MLRNLALMGRCKSLGSLKSLLWYVPQSSGASILSFLIMSLFRVHTGGRSGEGKAGGSCSSWLLDGGILFLSWLPSGLTFRASVCEGLIAVTSCLYWKDQATFFFLHWQYQVWGGGASQVIPGKGSPASAENAGSIPGSGRSPGEGNGNPLQHSCLGNPMDREDWWATVHGITKSWTRLSEWTWAPSRGTRDQIANLLVHRKSISNSMDMSFSRL